MAREGKGIGMRKGGRERGRERGGIFSGSAGGHVFNSISIQLGQFTAKDNFGNYN